MSEIMSDKNQNQTVPKQQPAPSLACGCVAWARTSPEDWRGDHHRLCPRAKHEAPFSTVGSIHRECLYKAQGVGDVTEIGAALSDHLLTCEASQFYTDAVVQERLAADRSCPECGAGFYASCFCPEMYTICKNGHGWEQRDGQKRVIARGLWKGTGAVVV